WLSFDDLVESHDPLIEPVTRGPDDLAVVCYTSGTSGSPKGVAHTHGSVFARHGGDRPRRVPGRMLVVLPLNSLGAGMLTGRLAHQWTEILLERFEPRSFLSAIEHHRVSTLVMMPSMGEALVALPELDRYDLSSLRYVGFTGAHVPAPLLARLATVLPVAPAVAYGMTETGGAVAASGLSSKPGSAGHIAKHVDVRIVGEDGQDLADGEVGEILVRTPWMGAGYYGQPEETAAAFADGWLRTGDLGFIDDDRELFIVGRRKDLIIQSGVKIHPNDVAEVIRRMPGAGECAVVGVPHAVLGEEVVACIVRQPDATITGDQVLAHCRAHLDARKVPARVWFCEELPKTASGKVTPQQLRDRLIADEAAVSDTDLVRRLRSAVPSERPPMLRETVERQLCRVALAAPRADDAPALHAGTTFGEIGLDSLGMAQF